MGVIVRCPQAVGYIECISSQSSKEMGNISDHNNHTYHFQLMSGDALKLFSCNPFFFPLSLGVMISVCGLE